MRPQAPGPLMSGQYPPSCEVCLSGYDVGRIFLSLSLQGDPNELTLQQLIKNK